MGGYISIELYEDIDILWTYVVNETYCMKELWRLWKDEYTSLRLVNDGYHIIVNELNDNVKYIFEMCLSCIEPHLSMRKLHSFEKAKWGKFSLKYVDNMKL